MADEADSILLVKYLGMEPRTGRYSSNLRFEILEALKGPLRQKEITVYSSYYALSPDFANIPEPTLIFVRMIEGTCILQGPHFPLNSPDLPRCISLTREYLKIKSESKDVTHDVKQWLISNLLESKPESYFQQSFAHELFRRSLHPTDWTYSNEELDSIARYTRTLSDHATATTLCLIFENSRPKEFEELALHILLTTKALQLGSHRFSRLIASHSHIKYAVMNKLDNDDAAFENGYFQLTNYLSEAERCEAITHLWIMNSNQRAYLKKQYDDVDPHGNYRAEEALVRRLSVSHPLPTVIK